jgi:murein DD-endopeptidase MepM/ murein hydrolase activator NlpD
MQFDAIRRCRAARAATTAILAGLVGGCAEQSMPAPVYFGGEPQPMMSSMPMPSPPPTLQVTVRRGQTLDGYAYTYHVPKSAIIAANGLRPPYTLEAGQRLVIPNAQGPVQQAMAPPPAPSQPWSPPPAAYSPPQPATPPVPTPQAPRAPEVIGSQAARPPQTIFTAPASPSVRTPPPATAQAATQPQTVTPPPLATNSPQIISLDSPPKNTAAATPPSSAPGTLTPPQAAPSTPVAPQASADPAPGGRFPWPLRGRVLANYGNAPGGGHNDGINIGAPLGTPVRAIDGGTVVYSGNEVKGYGNILLVRHANGWISAYAHLGDVAVKQGDTIAAGQVIAKVGNTGGVSEPQLHFELRRGQKPVNPTEFLAPAPSAEGPGGRAG